MNTSDYQKSIELLTSQSKFYINLGLERIEAILNLLGNPQNNIKIIHIAGTNGKGSVAATLSNILKCSGYKTGLYTSPHLVEYTERIKINNTDIDKNEFTQYLNKICHLADNNRIELTEFEILTAIAYKYFSDNNVDFAIMETGMGGRYDATNVCKNPILSIITSISLDHTDRLGNTIEKIAYEKAGIIKQNCPVVIAKDNQGFKVIENVAKTNNSPLFITEKDIEITKQRIAIINGKEYDFPLIGLYQKKNLALVMTAVDFLIKKGYKINIKEGLSTVKWAARLEFIPEKNILIDGAHNPDAAQELKKSLDYYFNDEPKLYIYSTINTKDYKTVAKILFKPDDEIYFYEFNHKNAVKYEEYKNNVSWLKNIKKLDINDFDKIIQSKKLKIITGSLYMIGEIYKTKCSP
ncbi:bifunctional folylpolyglutamate synthase/dihydrofolate synthase [bacterium]|nr:bifunctional folylpolyglutamate synthase/dihydrofolate synthase [bacterium]